MSSALGFIVGAVVWFILSLFGFVIPIVGWIISGFVAPFVGGYIAGKVGGKNAVLSLALAAPITIGILAMIIAIILPGPLKILGGLAGLYAVVVAIFNLIFVGAGGVLGMRVSGR
ncbi:MAG: hypothetical protein DRP01_03855 [Archaeoglobales archaeon]|nr:MAG: hypothetical protein DRP01_03855 [Archaeoglobales archaeon]